MTLVQTDLSQAELRVMAALSDDVWMLNALQEGQGDYFDEHMMPICFPGVDVNAIDAVTRKELRTQIKTVVYGLAFGRQAGAIAAELGISRAKAQAIINNYLFTAFGFAAWREEIIAAATDLSKRSILVTPFGRTFQSEVITGKNANAIEREALSFLPQGTASDICLTTAIRIHPIIKSMGGHIVALIHDAIIAEAPNPVIATEIGFLTMKEFRVTGEMVFGNKVPFLSEFSIGNTWGELK